MDGPRKLGVGVADGEAEEVEASIEGRARWVGCGIVVVRGEKRWGQ